MMERIYIVVLCTILLGSFLLIVRPVVASSEDSWVEKSPMQEARSHLGVTEVDGKIYAIGGTIIDSGDTGINEEYNPVTDTWTYKTPMPTPRHNFAIAAFQNKIYCIGGKANGSTTGIVEVYDPATDSWENKTDMPTPTSTQARVVNGRIYLIGGPLYLTQAYDPVTDSWSTKSSMPNKAIGALAVLDDKIYHIGGIFKDQTLFNYTTVTQIYNPADDKWVLAASPPTFFESGLAAATIGLMAPKRIYVFNIPYNDRISDPEDPLYRTQVYDPETDSWVAGAEITERRTGFAVAVLNDTFYAIGGSVKVGQGGLLEGFMPIYENSAANEQYLPFGYGTPDPSYQAPSPSPSPTPALSPTPNPTTNSTPTAPPTPTPTPPPTQTPLTSPSASQQPAQKPETQENQPLNVWLAVAAATVVAGAVLASVFVLKKRAKRVH